MRCTCLTLTAAFTILVAIESAGRAADSGPYKVLRTVKTGGLGGFDYIYADVAGRRLYIPRGAQATATPPVAARISVFDLDTLAPVGEIPDTRANGAAVDAKSGHGFASSKPVAMWDTKTLKLIKTIEVQGNPDGILDDPFNQRVYILSHQAPHVTVIDAKSGDVVGTLDLGGAPEQAVTEARQRASVNSQNYVIRAAGEEDRAGRRCYVLELTPRGKSPHLLRGRAWIDQENGSLIRIEGKPTASPSFLAGRPSVVRDYEKVGDFWLAKSSHAVSDSFFFGTTELSINYLDYQLLSEEPRP